MEIKHKVAHCDRCKLLKKLSTDEDYDGWFCDRCFDAMGIEYEMNSYRY